MCVCVHACGCVCVHKCVWDFFSPPVSRVVFLEGCGSNHSTMYRAFFCMEKKKINYSFNKCYHFVHRAGVLSVLCRWRNCREKTVSMNGDQVGEQPKEEGRVWCWDSSVPALSASAVFPWQSISSASRVCQ